MNGSLLGVLGAALVLASGLPWLYLMQRSRIPTDLRAFVAASAVAAMLGVAAFAMGTEGLGSVAAAVATVGGLAFLALRAGSGQARLTPTVAVGKPMLELTAHDDTGAPFDLARLRGTPYLFKFFRGHWCPYCVAELRRWELEIRPALDAEGVAIVTVCADTPEHIRAGRGKHGLRAVVLPDPDLAITDRFNLRNPKNFVPKPPAVIRPLPIPTTILVDAAGIVRWIDQATDYMQRSDPGRVLAAVREMLEPGECPQRIGRSIPHGGRSARRSGASRDPESAPVR